MNETKNQRCRNKYFLFTSVLYNSNFFYLQLEFSPSFYRVFFIKTISVLVVNSFTSICLFSPQEYGSWEFPDGVVV